LAGLTEAEFFWSKHKVKVRSRKKDGAKIKKGEIVAKIFGSAEAVLTTERTALNLIQRMSGIATATAQIVKRVGKNKVAATRKTPLGLLDCRAAVLGGGLPHRLSLADQILVKDNHLSIDPTCWQSIKSNQPFEIEADSVKLALEIAKYFQDSKNLVLLLDNFTPTSLKKLVPKLRTINPQITLEASGGITAKSAAAFLQTGVDYISLGALTHSSPALDLSLKII
jgi:nicotinate-nucleotide pyrophosphorylase (carboxylating)